MKTERGESGTALPFGATAGITNRSFAAPPLMLRALSMTAELDEISSVCASKRGDQPIDAVILGRRTGEACAAAKNLHEMITRLHLVRLLFLASFRALPIARERGIILMTKTMALRKNGARV